MALPSRLGLHRRVGGGLALYIAYLHRIVTNYPNLGADSYTWYFAGVVLLIAYCVSRPVKNLVVDDRASAMLMRAGLAAFLSSLAVVATVPVLFLSGWSPEQSLGLDETFLSKDEFEHAVLLPCIVAAVATFLLGGVFGLVAGFRQRALRVFARLLIAVLPDVFHV